MKKNLQFIIIIIVFFFINNAKAAHVLPTSAPQIQSVKVDILGWGPAFYASVDPSKINELNVLIRNSFNYLVNDADRKVEKFKNFENIAHGFSNSNTYASRTGMLQGYQNYDIVAVSMGFMAGMKTSPDGGLNIFSDIRNKGDIDAGVSMGFNIINIGFNTGFILPGLYMNGTFGAFQFKSSDDVYKIGNTLFGFGMNYMIAGNWSSPSGLLKWRGVSIGTGILYLANRIDLSLKIINSIDKIAYTDTSFEPDVHITADLIVDPSTKITIHSVTYTIPLDITSSVQLLRLINFNLGAGVDFNFGTTNITPNPTGSVRIDNIKIFYGSGEVKNDITMSEGYTTVEGKATNIRPTFVNIRITTGIGFNLGPVKIDFPVTYYFSSGMAVGMTVAAVW